MVRLSRPVREAAADGNRGPKGALRGQFTRSGGCEFSGFVCDPRDSQRKFVVELWLDGLPVRLARADSYVPALAAEPFGDGCYGFSFSLALPILGDSMIAEARVANTDEPVGQPVRLDEAIEGSGDSRGRGGVEWIGGLRFQGWVQCAPTESPLVRAVIDGEAISEARASGFSHIGGVENSKLVKAFDLHLPRDYADGRVRRAHFVTEDEIQLTVTPLAFVAFPDGAEQFFSSFAEITSERLRGRMLDRLLPASMPFTSYEDWRTRWDAPPPTDTSTTMAVLLVSGSEDEAALRSLDAQQHKNWVAAVLPPLDEPASFDWRELRDFLANDASEAEIVVFANAGVELVEHALTYIEDAFKTAPQARAVYGDVELRSNDGRYYPLALPAFDYERMLEQGYCTHVFAMTRTAIEETLATQPNNLYRLFNSQFDGRRPATAAKIAHIPFPLGRIRSIDRADHGRLLGQATQDHLASRGVAADTTIQRGALMPVAHVVRRPSPDTLTVIIPVRNRKTLLQTCLSSIAPAVTAAHARILVVDNDSSDADMIAYLEALKRDGVEVLSVPGPFNFARLNNLAVRACTSDQLLLLNNDIKALDAGWLDEMRSRLSEPDVGAVGALLLWPSGMIQHAGVALGPSFAAAHIGNDRLANDFGYGDMLRVARECSAVTAACLLTRRSDYLAVDGLDEIAFPVNFNDVDYCLKLRSLGKRIVWTPRARLYHHESASRGFDCFGPKAKRFERELRNLRDKWNENLIEDPYYHPALSLDPIPFSALAWPPRRRTARLNEPPRPLDLPPGF
ncbi:glycosyltransferase [Bradyrhizobium sp. Tv2a-2]|uniref:glycosyltransferase family 2 protein n=1 Tax=Bradyrhizobium sp. Tv2a-2 TaxID=113395 RepID=UPI000402E3AB|nr:glycosyltransferase [Bradyrhizobium sp. Tv2a-2]